MKLFCVHPCVQMLFLVVQFVDDPEGLQELGEVYAAIFVEVNAAGQVVDGAVVDVDPEVCAEQTPRLTKLLDGDQA